MQRDEGGWDRAGTQRTSRQAAKKRRTTPRRSISSWGVPGGDVIPGSPGRSHLGRPARWGGKGTRGDEAPCGEMQVAVKKRKEEEQRVEDGRTEKFWWGREKLVLRRWWNGQTGEEGWILWREQEYTDGNKDRMKRERKIAERERKVHPERRNAHPRN